MEDSLTSGRISVVCAAEARDLIARERSAFCALYPRASIEITGGPSREAVRSLFAAECDLAVLTRELEPEERAAAQRGGLELGGFRFARDAVVAVVHPGNPVENLTVDDLRRIYGGELTRWTAVGGRDLAVEPVTLPAASDLGECFRQEVMGRQPLTASTASGDSESDVAARVAARPGAIGYVSLAWADRGVRALRLAPVRGLDYWKPDMETVYKGEYPLTRSFTLYVRTQGKRLSDGFVTFVTSQDGQKLVYESGRVPTAVPVRFVRRSPMLGAH